MSYSTRRALQVASDRIVAQENQIQRALQVLQAADNVSVTCDDDRDTTLTVCSHLFRLVEQAVAILQEGQQ